MRTMGRIPVSVATPARFGGCDGRAACEATDAGGWGAGGEAAAFRTADRAGDQQLGGLPDRRDPPQDGHAVALWADGRQFRRGAPALSGGEDLRVQAAQPEVSVGAGTDRDRRPSQPWWERPSDRA